MEEVVRVAVDAMGGDYAPEQIVKGAAEALCAEERLFLYLVGNETAISRVLEACTYPKDRVEIVPASEVIEMAEAPVSAIRKKKDSSIVVAMRLVKDGKADAFVSAGSTGAVLVGGQILVGRIPGVRRTPLAPLLPTEKGVSLLIDCGANVDARSTDLVEFARMGSVYMENVVGVAFPRVGLLNIGAEEEKGNALVKETFPLLKECRDIRFIGSVEARDVLKGDADVIVCEAFTGNVLLKAIEGTAKTLMHMMKQGMLSSVRGKLGGALVKPALKEILKSFDATEYGGAPLLGCKGLVVKCHGSSNAAEIKNACLQCVAFHRQKINDKIEGKLMAGSAHAEEEKEASAEAK